MFTKPLTRALARRTLAIIALLFTTSALFAQVKIGTNPTTINPANNLEVEASTAGRKVSIDKTTGKVTIADGSQGLDRVLTSDANGVATWQSQNVGCASFEASRTTNQLVPINDSNGFPNTIIIPDIEDYDPSNAYNPATGEYTVPTTGFYAFKASSGDNIPGVTVATRNSTIYILSQAKGPISFAVVQQQIYLNGSYNSVSSMNYLSAGDKVTFQINVVHATGTKPAATIPVFAIQFSGSRIDCNKN
jgi:hypothetical protein